MLSKLTQNAVNTLLWVCKHQDSGPVTTDAVSKRLGLSVSYLESLFSRLKKRLRCVLQRARRRLLPPKQTL